MLKTAILIALCAWASRLAAVDSSALPDILPDGGGISAIEAPERFIKTSTGYVRARVYRKQNGATNSIFYQAMTPPIVPCTTPHISSITNIFNALMIKT